MIATSTNHKNERKKRKKKKENKGFESTGTSRPVFSHSRPLGRQHAAKIC
jgi:hypothetical protein